MKRPKSVWLAQVMLMLTAVFLTALIVKVYVGGGFPDGYSSLLDFANLFVLTILGASLWGFGALANRNKTGKWVALAALLGMASIMVYGVVDSSSGSGDFWDEPVVSLIVLLFLITIFIVPYIVSAVLLLFNPKVKIFFDPTLIPHESSAIFHEPPPPPRFDE